MICGRKQSGGLFLPTWQRAKRGDWHGSAEKNPFRRAKNERVTFVALLRELGLSPPIEPLRLAKSKKDRDFNFSVFFIASFNLKNIKY